VIASGFDKPEGTPEYAVTRVANSAVKPLDSAPSASANPTAPPSRSAPDPTLIRGPYIDLFDAHLRMVEDPQVGEGERRLLLDPTYFPAGKARVLAASAKVIDEHATSNTLHFSVTNIESRDEQDRTAIRLLLPRAPKHLTVEGKLLAPAKVDDGTVLLEFPARATPQQVEVIF
jgi:hypothetical protein